MAIDETWGNYFKSEVRTSGRKLAAQDKVSLAGASDTGIQAFVRVVPPFRVTLTAEDVASENFSAACTCPAAAKSQFCKHVWATLLCVEEKHPDFLLGKRSIESGSAISTSRPSAVSTPTPTSAAAAEKQAVYKASVKERASIYRKIQYQKAKLRAKERKEQKASGRFDRGGRESERETSIAARAYPAPIESALAYFVGNGFPMPDGPAEDLLSEAKRKLSRVFHPDKGGSHAEIVELNENCEVLTQFLENGFA